MLELLELNLDGFLSYGHPTKFVLNDPGITLITGPTGSGKSSIFEAVYYLLFGTTVRDKGSVAGLVYKSSREESRGYEISLVFKLGRDLYEIKEIRGRDGSGLFFSKNGDDCRGSDAGSTRQKVLDVLRITEGDFASLCFVGQDQTQTLVGGTSGGRAKEIIRIFGLDRYDNAIKACETDIKSITQKLHDLTKSREDLSKLVDTEKSGLNDLTPCNILHDVNILRDDIKTIEEQLDGLRRREKDLLMLMEKAASNRRVLETRSKIEKEMVDLQSKTVDTSGQYELECRLRELDSTNSLNAKKIAVCESKIKNAKSLGNKCPIILRDCPCNVPEQEKCNIISVEGALLSDLNQKRTRIEKDMKRVGAQISLFKESRNANSRLEKCIAILQGLELHDEVNVDECRSKLDQCKCSILSSRSKLAELHEDLIETNNRIAINRERANFRAGAEQKIQEYTSQLTSIDGLHTVCGAELLILQQSLSVLKKLKIYKIELVFDVLNECLQTNLSTISGGELAAEFVTQKLDATGKKPIESINVLVDDGYKKIPIGLVSGGQRAQVGIAMLLSMFETTQKMTNKRVSGLWMDEMFGPISNDRIHNVFDAIVELSRRIGVSSVKIITHKDIDTRAVDRVWRVSSVGGVTKCDN